MKVFRFMSENEFYKMSLGMVMHHTKRHAKRCYTDSVGFCFLNSADFDVEYAYEFLAGIVARNPIVVEFETSEDNLNQGYGIYADPLGDWDDTMKITEYCTTMYDIDTFKPIRYGVFNYFGRINWFEYN